MRINVIESVLRMFAIYWERNFTEKKHHNSGWIYKCQVRIAKEKADKFKIYRYNLPSFLGKMLMLVKYLIVLLKFQLFVTYKIAIAFYEFANS